VLFVVHSALLALPAAGRMGALSLPKAFHVRAVTDLLFFPGMRAVGHRGFEALSFDGHVFSPVLFI
jgi:hypothetical protein